MSEDHYFGLYNGNKLIAVSSLGDGSTGFEWYGIKGLELKRINENVYREFIKNLKEQI